MTDKPTPTGGESKPASKPKKTRYEHPGKSGIVLRLVNNRKAGVVTGQSWMVDCPARVAGQRLRKNFSDEQLARDFAEKQFAGHQEQGRAWFQMTESERLDATKALALVKPYSLSLEEVVSWALPRMKPPSGTKTLREVVDMVLAAKQSRLASGSLKPRTMAVVQIRLNQLASQFDLRAVSEITPQDLVDWLTAKPWSRGTKHQMLQKSSEVFDYAIDHGFSSSNPVKQIGKEDRRVLVGNDTNTKDPVILTPQQMTTLLATAPKAILPALVVRGFCGLRGSEACGLTWQDCRLDGEEPHLVVKAGVSKTGARRIVNIPSNAIAWLRLHQKPMGKVANYANDRTTEKAMCKVLAKCGIKGRGSLRHSFVSYKLALCKSADEVALLAGHDTAVMHRNYKALVTAEQAKAWFAIMPPNQPANVVTLDTKQAATA